MVTGLTWNLSNLFFLHLGTIFRDLPGILTDFRGDLNDHFQTERSNREDKEKMLIQTIT